MSSTTTPATNPTTSTSSASQSTSAAAPAASTSTSNSTGGSNNNNNNSNYPHLVDCGCGLTSSTSSVTVSADGKKRCLKIDLHSHILPRNWPDLKKKYGYGGWVQLEHSKNGSANMTIDGKFFRAIEKNAYDAGTTKQRKRKIHTQNSSNPLTFCCAVYAGFRFRGENCRL